MLVDIEVLPSSTLFEAGSTLRLDIRGDDAARYPASRHRRIATTGTIRIHTGPSHDSSIDVPVIEHSDALSR